MYTYQDLYKKAQSMSKDYSAATLIDLKQDINDGGAHFLGRFGRKANVGTMTTDLVANKQYYQFDYGVLRPSHIRAQAPSGEFWYSPELITSEDEWNKINSIEPTATFPIFWYVRGYEEVGLYPTPSQTQTAGLELTFLPQHIDLSQADFTSGTVTVVNGQTALTSDTEAFTPILQGQWLQVTDGSDGRWYRISAYVSATQLTLENYYEGISGGGRSFRIGQVMQIPNGFQIAPLYDALGKYYLTQKDQSNSNGYDARFERILKLAKATYGKSTASSGVRKSDYLKRKPNWIDLTPPVSYP